MEEETDSFLIKMPDDVFSPLSDLLALVMPGEVSGVVVEGLFLSDSFLLLEEGVCLFFEVFEVARN